MTDGQRVYLARWPKALYDHAAREHGGSTLIGLKKGDIVELIKSREDGWCKVSVGISAVLNVCQPVFWWICSCKLWPRAKLLETTTCFHPFCLALFCFVKVAKGEAKGWAPTSYLADYEPPVNEDGAADVPPPPPPVSEDSTLALKQQAAIKAAAALQASTSSDRGAGNPQQAQEYFLQKHAALLSRAKDVLARHNELALLSNTVVCPHSIDEARCFFF